MSSGLLQACLATSAIHIREDIKYYFANFVLKGGGVPPNSKTPFSLKFLSAKRGGPQIRYFYFDLKTGVSFSNVHHATNKIKNQTRSATLKLLGNLTSQTGRRSLCKSIKAEKPFENVLFVILHAPRLRTEQLHSPHLWSVPSLVRSTLFFCRLHKVMGSETELNI